MARVFATCPLGRVWERKLWRRGIKMFAVLILTMLVFNVWVTMVRPDKSRTAPTKLHKADLNVDIETSKERGQDKKEEEEEKQGHKEQPRTRNAGIIDRSSSGFVSSTRYDNSSGRPSSGTTNESPVPIILWWDPVPGQEDELVNCSGHVCQLTTDRQRWQEQEVMMMSFYGPALSVHELPVPRGHGHLWALFHDESPKNYDFLFSHQPVMELFNYTSTFRTTSHFPFPTQWLEDVAELDSRQYLVPVAEKSRLRKETGLAAVVYVQSDCAVPSDRDHLVSLLQHYIAVDSYGPCLNNKMFPNQSSLSFSGRGNMSPMTSSEFYRFLAQYKFTLAVENAVCPDYVTEKFWRPLHLGVVPIAFGAPNIEDYVPAPNSAFLVENFSSLEALSRAIQYYDEHDEEYMQLLPHKTSGISNPVLLKHVHSRPQTEHYRYKVLRDFHCSLCEKLHQATFSFKSFKTIPRSVANKDHFGCPKPGKFDDSGKYILDVKTGHWDVPFKRSEAMACVIRKLIENGERLSEEHFESLVKGTTYNFEDECRAYFPR